MEVVVASAVLERLVVDISEDVSEDVSEFAVVEPSDDERGTPSNKSSTSSAGS